MIMHINVILTNHVAYEFYPIGLFKPYICSKNICGTKLLWLDHLVSIYRNAFKIASCLILAYENFFKLFTVQLKTYGNCGRACWFELLLIQYLPNAT